MRMMSKVFWKKLFGVRLERLKKNIVVCLVVFFGLRNAGLQVEIGTFVLYLMTSVVTAGLMWQALSSDENRKNMSNMLMMPVDEWKFKMAYVGSLGLYTILVKTGILLAVVFAVGNVTGIEVVNSVLCTMNAIMMAAVIYSWTKARVFGILWAAAYILFLFTCNESVGCLPVLVIHLVVCGMILCKADSYAYYKTSRSKKKVVGSRKASVWKYMARYMMSHKNYLMNTVAMWGVACVLPMLLKGMDSTMVIPISFAILTLNTPICILLSSDTSLERAVRFLPGQRELFFLPYLLFIFFCNMMADVVFMISWELQNGGVNEKVLIVAATFAFVSAVGSVFLEWRFPLRNWKIESDMWHHPRKYIVPGIMVLCAGIIGVLQVLA